MPGTGLQVCVQWMGVVGGCGGWVLCDDPQGLSSAGLLLGATLAGQGNPACSMDGARLHLLIGNSLGFSLSDKNEKDNSN